MCAEYDDGKTHRFTHQVRDAGGRGGGVKTSTKHYRDTDYENGIPPTHQPRITKKGTYEGATAHNGGATGGVSIITPDS